MNFDISSPPSPMLSLVPSATLPPSLPLTAEQMTSSIAPNPSATRNEARQCKGDDDESRSTTLKEERGEQASGKEEGVRILASKQHELVLRLQAAVRDGERDALRIKKLQEMLASEAEGRRAVEERMITAHKLEMEKLTARHAEEEARLREVMRVEMHEAVSAYEMQLAHVRTKSAEDIKELSTAADAKIAGLESQVQELKKKLEEEVTSLAAAQEALDEVREERAKLEDDKAIKARAISQLQEAERLLKAEVSDLSHKVAKLTKLSDAQSSELEQLREQLEEERKASVRLAEKLEEVSQAYETFGERRRELEEVIAKHEDVQERKDASMAEALTIAGEAIKERDEMARKHRAILAELRVQVDISRAKDGVLTLEALRRVVEVIGEDVGDPDQSLTQRCEEMMQATRTEQGAMQVSRDSHEEGEEDIQPAAAPSSQVVPTSGPTVEEERERAPRRSFGRFHAPSSRSS
eukprot:95996-Hanusia_phi.AAC.2